MADTTCLNVAAGTGNETDWTQQGSAGLISLYGNPYLLCKGYIGTVAERYLPLQGVPQLRNGEYTPCNIKGESLNTTAKVPLAKQIPFRNARNVPLTTEISFLGHIRCAVTDLVDLPVCCNTSARVIPNSLENLRASSTDEKRYIYILHYAWAVVKRHSRNIRE